MSRATSLRPVSPCAPTPHSTPVSICGSETWEEEPLLLKDQGCMGPGRIQRLD